MRLFKYKKAFSILLVFKLFFIFSLSCNGNKHIESEPSADSEKSSFDWRDQIIYQILTDRFANGDNSNDINVDLSKKTAYHGGDWQGIIDKIPYLKELGVTAVWISPVNKNLESDSGYSSYHGYWPQDFKAVNPHFGDLAKLKEMVNKLHQNDIKVILDVVANHTAQLFYYDINQNQKFDDSVEILNEKGEKIRVSEKDPPYSKDGIKALDGSRAKAIWFNDPEENRVAPSPKEFANTEWYNRRGHVTIWGTYEENLQNSNLNAPETKAVLEQEIYGDFPSGLKDLNTELPEVRKALIDVYKFWIKEIDIDGFRVDTVKHVEPEFWGRFCYEIRKYAKSIGKDNFFLIGEIFDGRLWKMARYTKPVISKVDDGNGKLVSKRVNQFDSVLAFNIKYDVYGRLFKGDNPTSSFSEVMDKMKNAFYNLPAEDGIGVDPIAARIHFVDNHDVSRFLSGTTRVMENGGFDSLSDEEKIKADNVFIPTFGLMLSMDGVPLIYYGTEQGFSGGWDPENREDLWDSNYNLKNPYFDFLKKMNRIRSKLTPLRRGDLKVSWSSKSKWKESEDAGILAFERNYKDETVLVVVNSNPFSASKTKLGDKSLLTSLKDGRLYDHVSEKEDAVVKDSKVIIEIPPRSIKILTSQPNQ